MTLNKIKLAGITLILFIAVAGCREKDDLTLPVRVELEIGVSLHSLPGYYTFQEGHIGIQSIQFEGKREIGEDIFVETDPEINFPVKEFKLPKLISFFDIPQGIYDYMNWNVNLKRVVIDDYTDSQSKGLILSGWYVRNEWDWTRIIIAVDDTEKLSIRACDPYDNFSIVLTADKEYKAVLYLYLDCVFSSISQQSLEEADISNVNGESTILISSETNENLYENILYRLTQSAKIIVM